MYRNSMLSEEQEVISQINAMRENVKNPKDFACSHEYLKSFFQLLFIKNHKKPSTNKTGKQTPPKFHKFSGWLNLMILKVFSNINDSMVLKKLVTLRGKYINDYINHYCFNK